MTPIRANIVGRPSVATSIKASIAACYWRALNQTHPTAVTLAELGRSEFEIMVLGHKRPNMAAYYCRKANKTRLNYNAIRAWEIDELSPG
jgi:hypothetical protein